MRDRRHLVFATDEQLLILSRAKTWYVDGTFKLCKAPFTQLLTINAFVRSEEHAKQIPLVFVLMSGKKKKDYRAVMKEILRLLPNQPSVKKVTIDFERAMWSTFRKLLPEVRIMGCAFHWTQALWRKVSINLCHLEQFSGALILFNEGTYDSSLKIKFNKTWYASANVISA